MSRVDHRINKSFESKSCDNELEICEFPDDDNPDVCKPDIRIHMSSGLGMLAYEFDSKEQLDEIISYLYSVRERWS